MRIRGSRNPRPESAANAYQISPSQLGWAFCGIVQAFEQYQKHYGPRKPGGFRGPRAIRVAIDPSLARAENYFFGAASLSAFSAAFFSSLVEGAAGAASTFSSLLSFEAPQPQSLLFTSPPQLEQPQSLFFSSPHFEQPQSLFFSSQPQLLASQPQLDSQQVWQPPQLPWLPENRLLKQPPWQPWLPLLPKLGMLKPPWLPQLMCEPPQLPLLPPKKAKALQGTAKTATIKAIRERFISIVSIRVRVSGFNVATWRNRNIGRNFTTVGRRLCVARKVLRLRNDARFARMEGLCRVERGPGADKST